MYYNLRLLIFEFFERHETTIEAFLKNIKRGIVTIADLSTLKVFMAKVKIEKYLTYYSVW